MQWQFKEWGADVVLAGHDHDYERLLVNGLPYFVNGAGGASLYSFKPALPETQMRYNKNYGAMRVEATNTTMKFQFFTRDNVLIDEYALGDITPAATITPTQFFTPTATATPAIFTPTATLPPAIILPPNLINPPNNATLSARFDFTWTKIYNATRYQIDIDNNANFSSPEWSTLRSDTIYQIASMPKGIYYWRVRAKNMAGIWSAWSTVFKMTVP